MSIHPDRLLDMELAVMAAERLVLVGFEHRHFEALREMLMLLKARNDCAERIKAVGQDETLESFRSLREGFGGQIRVLRGELMIAEGGDDWDGSELEDEDIAVKQFETAMGKKIDDAENALLRLFAQ